VLRDVIDQVRQQALVPDVIAERCVHSLIEKASCRACADSCPENAWVIDDDLLGIDSSRCDGCGLCVAACPQSAVQSKLAPVVPSPGEEGGAFAYCVHASVPVDCGGRIPCLHGIGMTVLLDLTAKGITRLVTSSGDCDRCPRGRDRRLEQRIDALAAVLQDRDAKSLRYQPMDGDSYRAALERAHKGPGRPRLNRRAFFSAMARVPVTRVEAALTQTSAQAPSPSDRLPPRRDGRTLHAPQLHGAVCRACDACVKLCPQGALRFEAARENRGVDGPTGSSLPGPWYRLDADRCTGCGVCVDVCDADAIELHANRIPGWERLPLVEGRCISCGVVFNRPQNAGSSAASRCRICAETDHHRNLYQVL
jgi:Pyruvate/2-oxoacid:ferredoxin oxidoreductase delta subunit